MRNKNSRHAPLASIGSESRLLKAWLDCEDRALRVVRRIGLHAACAWLVVLAGAAWLSLGDPVNSAAAQAAAPDSALAAVAEGSDADFDWMLRSIDTVPPSADALTARWADAEQRLIAAANNASLDRWPRQRAISLLSLFLTDVSRSALEALASSDEVDVRRLAVYTLGRGFGQPGDAGLVTIIQDAVENGPPRVRDHAIRSLRWVDHSAALELLDVLRSTHAESSVRALAERTATKRAARLVTTR